MKHLIGYFFIFLALHSCTSTRTLPAGDDHKIGVTFIQINDVYEIGPLENGKSGGMARVATLKKMHVARNKNTYLLMAGDFLSPSVFNSLQYEGRRIRGRQMIEAMNVAGTDIAVFGNHEFDISESDLQSRINESSFRWVSSNAFHKRGADVTTFVKIKNQVAEPIPEYYLMKLNDADGTTATIGFIGLTLPFNKANYVSYSDPAITAEKIYHKIKDSCDAVVAITHQSIEADIELAKKIPGLSLIVGGHEHDQRFEKIGNVRITKAHANARTAYILELSINKKTKTVKTASSLVRLDESIAFDASTDSVVKKWTAIADSSYTPLGFNAERIILTSGEPLDGRETEVRTRSTNLTRHLISAMEAAAPQADLAIVNAGSIRVDDVLQMPVSEYDILRSLPFGGGIAEVDMTGSLLLEILEAGRKNRGIGGFLHYSANLEYIPAVGTAPGQWQFKNNPILPGQSFRVALSEFLITGGEANMEFLKSGNPGISKIYEVPKQTTDLRSDIRLALINYFGKK